MLFKFIFKILKNLRWVITLVLILGGIYFAIMQYQAIKATPLGSFLPSITIPQLNSIITTPIVDISTTPTPKTIAASERIYIDTTKGKVSYLAEVAQTEEARALGLMYRTSLGQYAGMYFIFDTDTTAGFWMKNCEIPLDMLFINAQGIIIDIKENIRPCKETDPTQAICATYIPKDVYRTVLEINGGSSKMNGIAIGQKVTVGN